MPDVNKPITDLQESFKKAFSTLSPVIGNEVVNFAKDNFKMQGFMDLSFDPWKPRKNNKDPGRAILHKTGAGERSVHVIRHNIEEVVVGTTAEVPYMKAHNEGFDGTVIQNVKTFQRKTIKGVSTVKAHKRTIHQHIPQRKFLGKSSMLTTRMARVAIAHFRKFVHNS